MAIFIFILLSAPSNILYAPPSVSRACTIRSQQKIKLIESIIKASTICDVIHGGQRLMHSGCFVPIFRNMRGLCLNNATWIEQLCVQHKCSVRRACLSPAISPFVSFFVSNVSSCSAVFIHGNISPLILVCNTIRGTDILPHYQNKSLIVVIYGHQRRSWAHLNLK